MGEGGGNLGEKENRERGKKFEVSLEKLEELRKQVESGNWKICDKNGEGGKGAFILGKNL